MGSVALNLTEQIYVRRRMPVSRWLGWVLLVLLAAAGAAAVYYFYLPLRADRARLSAELETSNSRIDEFTRRFAATDSRFTKLEQKQKHLLEQLKKTVAEKDKLEAELKRIQGELTQKLEPEIQSGNVRIKRRGRELVVDLADQILFDSGQAEVNESGQVVLDQVSQALADLQHYTIQVGGHTDSTQVVTPKTQERFPTNWELSTARATNVVRYMQEHGKIPGQRLVAAGFAEFRPTSTNNTAEGRAKNRRIELVLLPIRSPSADRTN